MRITSTSPRSTAPSIVWPNEPPHVALAVAALGALVLGGTGRRREAGSQAEADWALPEPHLRSLGPWHQGVFVVERGGTIRLVKGKHRRTFLDISSQSAPAGERGLLSVAFAPNYASSRLFYIYFTNRPADIVIAELHADPNGRHASAGSMRQLLLVPHPSETNHNGGQLQFGPDGFLYAGTGDGGEARRSERQRPEPELDARQAAAHRPGLRRDHDLLERPAQPVPILLRPDHRPGAAANRDRRRGPGPLRGDRLPDASRRPTARTSAGTTSRGSPRSRAPTRRPRAGR